MAAFTEPAVRACRSIFGGAKSAMRTFLKFAAVAPMADVGYLPPIDIQFIVVFERHQHHDFQRGEEVTRTLARNVIPES